MMTRFVLNLLLPIEIKDLKLDLWYKMVLNIHLCYIDNDDLFQLNGIQDHK